MEYACSTWSLLLRPAECLPSEPSDRLINSGNIFLLVNLIILALLVHAHVQQHAPSAAAPRWSSSRKKPQLQHTKRLLLGDHRQAASAEKPMENSEIVGLEEAANSSKAFPISSAYSDWRPLPAPAGENWKEDPRDPSHRGPYVDVASAAMESSIWDAAPIHENLSTGGQESSTLDSHLANGSDVEQIVLGEDGRLRLVNGDQGVDAAKTGDGGPTTLANEDAEGSDAEKVVLQNDGLHRFTDRPLPVSGITSCKPLKSLSDMPYCAQDDNQDTNSEINRPNHDIQQSITANHSSLSEPIYYCAHHSSSGEPINGCANLDHSSDRALDQDSASFSSESSTAASRQRPISVKKADSTDTNKNKDKKHLIRQSSRQDFKLITRGLVRGSHGNINSGSGKGRSSAAVRREPSIGQEELNVRVESFIARFNEQIRIQRQDSILSFMQMVDRGA